MSGLMFYTFKQVDTHHLTREHWRHSQRPHHLEKMLNSHRLKLKTSGPLSKSQQLGPCPCRWAPPWLSAVDGGCVAMVKSRTDRATCPCCCGSPLETKQIQGQGRCQLSQFVHRWNWWAAFGFSEWTRGDICLIELSLGDPGLSLSRKTKMSSSFA